MSGVESVSDYRVLVDYDAAVSVADSDDSESEPSVSEAGWAVYWVYAD